MSLANNDNSAEFLSRVRALIQGPQSWCKRQFAKNDKGEPVDPRGRNAVMFCLSGACLKEYQGSNARYANKEIAETLRSRGEFGGSVVMFNDAEYTTHKDVLNLLDETLFRVKQMNANL